MPTDHILEYALMAISALLGWFVKVGREDHKELAREVGECVRKDDFKEAVRDLKDHNRAIFAQLDRQDDKLDSIRNAVADKADRRELLEQRECKAP
ncbi:hypothetical protein UFOVP555_6 [uncultured Caudovirales phage]|uniref:Uncharacterized protein n=1 Tax=uncultured Caudovirales phage TaxID=2100421 RepID=A0A6J5MRS1_9CAUD|nr:hypothetical protein UFOVP555_6 [uncultured Caudovirales phage]